MIRILVVDDEKNIIRGIRFSLEQDGMIVDEADDGEKALFMAQTNNYDLILLDVMLPKIEGTEVCRRIRETSTVPVIMLTAKGGDMDKIMGLEYGADDYITKPFNTVELKARIKAILRRTTKAAPVPEQAPHILKIRDLTIDSSSKRVTMSNIDINLTAKEYDLLEFLVKYSGKVYTREKLLENLWDTESTSGDVRTVDVHVRRLREKIEENPSEPKYIFTKWGVGYYIR